MDFCRNLGQRIYGEESYCYKMWHITDQQRDNDPDIIKTRIVFVASMIFFLLSIVFCGLMLNYNAPLKIYIPLFATSLSLAIVPSILRCCCCTPPKPFKPPVASARSSPHSNSDEEKE